jgi:hypothetical protein
MTEDVKLESRKSDSGAARHEAAEPLEGPEIGSTQPALSVVVL